MHAYEVFRQDEEGEPLQHVGSVLAPNRELAIQYARDVYSRRYEAQRLWVVPREAITEVNDADFLQPPLDHTYRMGATYRVTVEKRRQIKEMFKKVAREVTGEA
ncbi:phenylacetic acid degradation protein PaaB [Marinithermus hydrothermalis]|uniref:Phenylacetic acid degradation B n=1 Tax=Marinithermus hydrothermalis (strain DSM 14884 / JCM 11576 / T1) TaxID=869210 RepID=F2NLK3_MARHT|nr:phenylacetic acid degradation protein PaaB [Marinithermus hydrothermalis]AEB12102.1 phenylacetic acid degradation B [Marinithermus hydrothermalis DSM 14884]